jgi:hypothetical protein
VAAVVVVVGGAGSALVAAIGGVGSARGTCDANDACVVAEVAVIGGIGVEGVVAGVLLDVGALVVIVYRLGLNGFDAIVGGSCGCCSEFALALLLIGVASEASDGSGDAMAMGGGGSIEGGIDNGGSGSGDGVCNEGGGGERGGDGDGDGKIEAALVRLSLDNMGWETG